MIGTTIRTEIIANYFLPLILRNVFRLFSNISAEHVREFTFRAIIFVFCVYEVDVSQ